MSRGARLRDGNEYSLTVLGERIDVKSPLTGVHQQRNIALAIAAAVELRNYHGYNNIGGAYCGWNSQDAMAG